MSLYITSLNSGSNGNCYYVGNGHEAVLIDAGISCRETEKRMKRLELEMAQVKAIFVSHEHGDHITGIPALSKKFRLPVYITEATYSNSHIPIEADLIRHFQPHDSIGIGDIAVTAFPKFHDAAEPHSFLVSSHEVNVGIFTDLGFACEQLVRHFKQCHAAFLEANYDVNMLEKGNYPYHLKKRISGGQGHLSNEQALQLFLQHRPAHMSHLVLAHLSKNNNHPKLVEDLFQQHAGNTRIVVASRYQETEVYHIQAHGTAQVVQQTKPPAPSQVQLSLF